MAWINSTSVAALTLLGVAVMGIVPTSAGLDAGAELPCRAVFSPIAGANLTDGLVDDQRRVVDEWLEARAADPATSDDLARAATHAASLCGEAQGTRSVWMILTAVFGIAIAFGLRGWGTSGVPSDPRDSSTATPEG